MAQTGFTPIQIYRSSTASATPTSGNLVAGELAINTADGKLFYLDNLNAVQVIGWKLVPVSAGGTGLSSYTTGDTLYSSATNTLAKLPIGSTGEVLTVASGLPAWSSLPAQVYPGAGIPNSTGSAWGTSYGVTGTGSVVLSDSPTFTTAITSTGALQLTGSDTVAQNIATNQTTGSLTIGGASATGAITLGQSTGGQSVSIANGAGASGNINIGGGSATTGLINIGGTGASTGAISIGRSTGAQTVNIATGVNTASTKTVNIGTGGTTTTNITMGNTAGSSAITLGQSTGTQQINIGNGATLNAISKNIIIGNGGAVGSTTNILVGNQARPLTCFINLYGIVTFGTSFSQTPVTVANLPSGVDAVVGDRYIVSNALAPTFGSTVVGGGAVVIPVYYDGTNWKVG